MADRERPKRVQQGAGLWGRALGTADSAAMQRDRRNGALGHGFDMRFAQNLPDDYKVIAFAVGGVLTVLNNAAPYVRSPVAGTIEQIVLDAVVGPTGADLVVEVNKNGTQIAVVRIPVGADTGMLHASAVTNTTVAEMDRFNADITQVGSSVAGETLTVSVRLRVKPIVQHNPRA